MGFLFYLKGGEILMQIPIATACERCGKLFVYDDSVTPKYVISEVLPLDLGDVREEIDMCPECLKDLERFMEYKEVHILAGVEENGSVE